MMRVVGRFVPALAATPVLVPQYYNGNRSCLWQPPVQPMMWQRRFGILQCMDHFPPLHTWVRHKKKKVKVNGKMIWIQPKYVKLYTHKLPEGGKLQVKGGTQIMDRFWSSLRDHLGTMKRKPNSAALTRRIRSAQWVHWHRTTDLWLQTGKMVELLFHSKHV